MEAAWPEDRYLMARAIDYLSVLAHGMSLKGDPEYVRRPMDSMRERERAEKAARVHATLTDPNIKWKEAGDAQL